MRRTWIGLAAAVAWAMGSVAQTPPVKDWQYAFPITNTEAPAGFVRVPLTPAVVDVSTAGLADLRLVAKRLEQAPRDEVEKALVPYMLHFPPSGETVIQEWKPIQVLNRVYEEGRYEQIVLDFGEPAQKNRLKIDLSGENFRRRVSIEGSADGQAWSMVRDDGWLFDISQPHGEYEVNVIDFPLNDFRYVRVTVHHMSDDPRRIEIESIETLHYEATVAETAVVPVVSMDTHVDEAMNATNVDVDLQYRNLPVTRITLTTAEPYFYRAFELFGRNEEMQRIERKTETGWDTTERESPWNLIGQGVLYRIQENGRLEERVFIECSAPYRYLRVRIHNEDNPPLDVTEVDVIRLELPSLVFENKPDQALVLLCGNDAVGPPRFDLAQSVRDLDAQTLPVVSLGDTPTMRVITAQAPWTARNGWVIWLALAVAVLVVAGLIYSNLSRMKVEPGE